MKLLSGALLIITVVLSVRHGWAGLSMKPETSDMLTELGLGTNRTILYLISVLTLSVALLVLFPQTFFAGNLINAGIILLIMALSLNVGNLKTALLEIPFLLIPLVLIYLGHPLKK